MLGPLFFLLYINEIINNASNLLNLILFADDTNVFMSHKDLNYLSDTAISKNIVGRKAKSLQAKTAGR